MVQTERRTESTAGDSEGELAADGVIRRRIAEPAIVMEKAEVADGGKVRIGGAYRLPARQEHDR